MFSTSAGCAFTIAATSAYDSRESCFRRATTSGPYWRTSPPGSSIAIISLLVWKARSNESTTSFVKVAIPHSRGGNEPRKRVRGTETTASVSEGLPITKISKRQLGAKCECVLGQAGKAGGYPPATDEQFIPVARKRINLRNSPGVAAACLLFRASGRRSELSGRLARPREAPRRAR